MFFRLLHGFKLECIYYCWRATIASDTIPRPRLGEGMGFYGLTSVIALAISPAISLKLVDFMNYESIFFIGGALGIIGALMALGLKLPKMEKRPIKKEDHEPLYEKSAYRPAVTIFFICLTYGALLTFIALYAAQEHIPNIGIFFYRLCHHAFDHSPCRWQNRR